MITAAEAQERRKKLAKLLPNNSVAILFAGASPRKSGDETYPFTPNRNFYYLTNIAEQNDILAIFKIGNKVDETLFINPYDEVFAKWNGAYLSEKEATDLAAIRVDYLYRFRDFFQLLVSRLEVKSVYLDLERQGYQEDATAAQRFAGEIKAKYPALNVNDVYATLATLRTVKSPAEIETIKKAGKITEKAIAELMKQAKAAIGKTENYLEAYFDWVLKQEGASGFAFDTIAAAGENACTLHYRANNGPLKDGDLVMFDCGAEYEYYKSDVTRTFPLNGKFTPRQLEIYNIVLRAQDVVAKHARPGITLRELNNYVVDFLASECQRIGLISEKAEIGKYYMHSCSHHIGLDTHDASIASAKLVPGCVISNEPGLYIPEEGIGIRIEDDLLITQDGCEYLTKDIIKKPEDIENYMKRF